LILLSAPSLEMMCDDSGGDLCVGAYAPQSNACRVTPGLPRRVGAAVILSGKIFWFIFLRHRMWGGGLVFDQARLRILLTFILSLLYRYILKNSKGELKKKSSVQMGKVKG
jgi:hypothetical protein